MVPALQALESVTRELKPRRPLARIESTTITFDNMVGGMVLTDGTVVSIEPKVPSSNGWAEAVVDLLEPDTRIAIAHTRQARPADHRPALNEAIAREYARRLERALRAEGPIHVYERTSKVSNRPIGHLNLTRWSRTAFLDPTRFPVSQDILSPVNDFTRGMAIVARWLSRTTGHAEIAMKLRRLESAITGGHPTRRTVSGHAARRPLPAQWKRFGPTWAIASPILQNRTLAGPPGFGTGLEVAVEPWPLLETALQRALFHAGQLGVGLRFESKRRYVSLRDGSRAAGHVEPDGVLMRDGHPAATFEAKYTVPQGDPSAPHVAQALTACATLGSPVAVIVYPGGQPIRRFDVVGFQGGPITLVTMGLNLFDYVKRSGDAERARLVATALAA